MSSILVLAETADRPFGSPGALAELLRLEGVNDLESAPLERLSPALLGGRALVLLGPADPAPEAVDLLLDHVASGGGLVCLAPGEAFADRLGLKHHLTGQLGARIRVPLDGFPESGLPVKGWSQHYSAEARADAAEIAPLLDSEGSPTGFPAILQLAHGNGTVILLAYDLAASVYLLRQGNPLLAGARSSGFARMRPSDLFDGWQHPADASHPVADLHTHLLRELLHRAWPAGTVLPWLWYFPEEADTALVLTSDDDWSRPEHFEQLVEACEAHSARLTFYLVRQRSAMGRPWLEELAGLGFDFSIHPDLRPPIHPLWESRLSDHIRQFQDAYGRDPSPSVRNHAITWSGYLAGARIEARHGFTFDANYFSLLPQGRYYMAGAGLPLSLADLSGEVLPIFQLPTQFSDETTLGGQGFPWSLDLTPDEGVELVTGLMRENAGGRHSMLCVNAHPVSFATYSAPLWTPVMQYARAQGIPVLSVDRFSRFWHARREVRLRPVPEGQTPLEAPVPALRGLSALIPASNPPPGGKTRTLHGRTFAVYPLDTRV